MDQCAICTKDGHTATFCPQVESVRIQQQGIREWANISIGAQTHVKIQVLGPFGPEEIARLRTFLEVAEARVIADAAALVEKARATYVEKARTT